MSEHSTLNATQQHTQHVPPPKPSLERFGETIGTIEGSNLKKKGGGDCMRLCAFQMNDSERERAGREI